MGVGGFRRQPESFVLGAGIVPKKRQTHIEQCIVLLKSWPDKVPRIVDIVFFRDILPAFGKSINSGYTSYQKNANIFSTIHYGPQRVFYCHVSSKTLSILGLVLVPFENRDQKMTLSQCLRQPVRLVVSIRGLGI